MVLICGNEYDEYTTNFILSCKKITEIPLEVFTLTNLHILYIYNSEISAISQEIKYLINLNSLYLNHNKISVIPKEIKYLTNLHSLYLGSTEILILPQEIKYLTNLYTLTLDDNEISVIPEEIKYLTNLHTLYLSRNKISVVPEEIKYLTNLKELYLNYNKISTIPNEIKYLTNLHTINLTSNKISVIPYEIKYLTNLKELYLNNNNISVIPKEIKYLTNLQILDLGSNKISVVLEEIKYLTNLQNLYLSNNNISSLPIEIINCRQLNNFGYNNNPIEEIDIRITRFIDRMYNYNNHGLFSDSQNVHSSSIQQSTNKSINNLMKDIISVPKEDLIKELILLNPKCLEQLIEYLEVKDVHSILLINFEDLFLRVFQRIILSEHKTELLIRLDDEMSDSMCKCFTGRLTRLVNVLVGFSEDIEINISGSERISAIILSVLSGSAIGEMTDELKEICITKLKEAGIEKSEIEKWLN